MDVETDYCVVGAGPAGLTLTLLLLRSGARVALIERSHSFERQFRGEILQPGAMRLLDELGVLDDARSRGCHEHDKFVFLQRGQTVFESDYRKLPGPYNCLLSIPQQHILEALLSRCQRYDGFAYLARSRVVGLISDGGQVRGVECEDQAGRRHVQAHCVVAADGRYSKVRRLAGIATSRRDDFGQDVMWFKLPAEGELPRSVRIFRDTGPPMLCYATVPGSLQFGWTLPHGGHALLATHGLGYIKEQICAAIPPYADLIERFITRPRDLSLLDVFSASATEWVRDGLVLIGDSAHTHSPIGAQGINLAIQDAVLVHPLLITSLASKDASRALLQRYPARRKPFIDRINKIQLMQSRMMLSSGGAAARVRPAAARLMSHSPLFRVILRQLAFGDPKIQISGACIGSESNGKEPACD